MYLYFKTMPRTKIHRTDTKATMQNPELGSSARAKSSSMALPAEFIALLREIIKELLQLVGL